MTIDRHVNGCDCRIDHRDYITADGLRNLATYLIDPECYQAGVRAGAGMLWRVGPCVEQRHSDLDTIDLDHDLGMRDLTDPFTGSPWN
jgi:hypothetical protein